MLRRRLESDKAVYYLSPVQLFHGQTNTIKQIHRPVQGGEDLAIVTSHECS